TPALPHVLHPSTTALRRSCSNSVARTRRPGKRLRRGIGGAVDAKTKARGARLHSYLNRILSESGRLGNRPAHSDRSRTIRSRIGTRARPSPTAKAVAYLSGISWGCANR